MNVWTRKSADDPYCANCSLTWDMHIAGSNACPSTEYHIIRRLEWLAGRVEGYDIDAAADMRAKAQLLRGDGGE